MLCPPFAQGGENWIRAARPIPFAAAWLTMKSTPLGHL